MKALLICTTVGLTALSTASDDPAKAADAQACCQETPAVCCEVPAGALALEPALLPPLPVHRGVDPALAGSIKGKVMFDGKAEKLPKLSAKADAMKGCAHGDAGMDMTDRTLEVDAKGGVANVVFLLEADGVEVELSKPAVVDQRGCRFEPHVQVVPKGGTIQYLNSDSVNHNIHTYSRKNDAKNKNVSGGSSFEQKLANDESFEIKCDIHPWMKAHVIVTEATHWGISGKDGSFEIANVPAGKYKLTVWHEKLGKGKTSEVTVEAGKTAELTHKRVAKKGGKKKSRR